MLWHIQGAATFLELFGTSTTANPTLPPAVGHHDPAVALRLLREREETT